MSILGPEGSHDTVAQFWRHTQCTSWGQAHPALQAMATAELRWLVPLFFHQDGVEVHTNVEYESWCWSTPFSSGKACDTRFPILFLRAGSIHNMTERACVEREVARFVQWSLAAAEAGVGPSRGVYDEPFPRGSLREQLAGKTLAGGWRAAYAGWKGDAKARRLTHRFCSWYNCTDVCDGCFAKRDDGPLSYRNLTTRAPWRDTLVVHESYIATEPHVSPWSVVRGWALENTYRDLTHNVYLGIARDVVATCMVEFLEEGLLGPGQANAVLARLMTDCRDWCGLARVPRVPGRFTLASLGRTSKKEFPCMSQLFKASHMKTLLFYTARKARGLDTFTDRSRKRRCCTWALVQALHVCDTAGLFLAPAQVAEVVSCGELFFGLYHALAAESAQNTTYCWLVRPKMHYFQHMIIDVAKFPINFRYTQTLQDEDFLGKMKRVGSRCHGATVGHRALERHLLHLGVRWARRRKTGAWVI